MKIGILTQPLENNYGGLLQAYALQNVLKKMGHDPWIINRVIGKKSFLFYFGSFSKRIIFKYILQQKHLVSPLKMFKRLTEEEETIISQNTSKFKKKYIFPATKPIDNNEQLKNLTSKDFEAFVVGSDQVWRRHYSPNIYNYYLDFTASFKNVKRIAYAASFGLTNWHYPPMMTKKVKKLIQLFDAVSVREDMSVDMCKEFLNIEAQHVLDPTMLLKRQEYIEIVKNEGEQKSNGELMIYFLDKSEVKINFETKVASELGLFPFEIMPKKKYSFNKKNNIYDCIYPSVSKWLRGFVDAKFVLTDSFHGCVFSILFNVPFVVIGNAKRGISRFNSLLKLFNLEDRLIILDQNNIDLNILHKQIDWESINNKLETEKIKSYNFITKNLIN